MKKIKSILKKFPQFYKVMSEINYFRLYRKHKEIFMKSPEDLINHIYSKYHNRNLDLSNPTTFNEKLQWLKLYWFDERAIMCCDKYLVREFVKEKKLDYILNDLEGKGIYSTPDEINVDDLPEKFVLKTTHDSGHIVLCTNKSNIKWRKIFNKMNRWLKVNYGFMSGEWPYSAVKPQIICESYLTDASSKDLIDYKIFCFNGKPEYIQVDLDRYSNHKRNFYDTNWNLLDIEYLYPRDTYREVKKPEVLDDMIDIAYKLSEDFPFVRVDLYNTSENEIIFGELTFFPEGGTASFSPQSWNEKMGDKIILPKKQDAWVLVNKVHN